MVLAYGSMEDVELALGGRPLSTMEHLWYTHTVSITDATIYSFTIVVLFAVLHVVGFSNFLLPRLFPSFFLPSKIQPHTHITLTSILYIYFSIFLIYGLLITPLLLHSYPLFKLIGIRMDLSLPSLGEIIAQNLVYFLIQDYMTYWFHRWYHTDWAYKLFHHVHHEYSSPESFTSIYAHPLEVLFGFVPALVGVFIVPPHIITFWIWIAINHLHAFEIHSGYDLRWTPTRLIPFYGGSKYHDYHHRYGAKCASNFSHGLTIFDTIHGTNKGYLTRERQRES